VARRSLHGALSRLPTVRDVWHAARDGADLMPPLNLF
jgi:hypothetical protein